jgi:hypothetical protein
MVSSSVLGLSPINLLGDNMVDSMNDWTDTLTFPIDLEMLVDGISHTYTASNFQDNSTVSGAYQPSLRFTGYSTFIVPPQVIEIPAFSQYVADNDPNVTPTITPIPIVQGQGLLADANGVFTPAKVIHTQRYTLILQMVE